MIAKMVPVEDVALTWLDYAGRIENLRTSLITYPENGRVPKLVEGVRRVPGPDQIFAALIDAKGAPPVELLSALAGGSKKDGPARLLAGRTLSVWRRHAIDAGLRQQLRADHSSERHRGAVD